MRGYLATVAHQCRACLDQQELDVPAGRQWDQHPGFVAAELAYDCQQCIAWHGARYQFPTLGAANQQAWALYLELQDQQRAGGFGTIGLDMNVVPTAFEMHQIPPADQLLLWQKLLLINRAVLAHEATKREAEARAKQAKTHVDV